MNTKTKVFLCITKSTWGGAQKYVYDIATGAKKDEIDMTVLLGGDGELKKRLDDAGIQTILLKNSQRDIHLGKEFGLFFELYKLFQKEKPDVLHLNSSKMSGTGALVGRLLGIKKIIFIAHGWAFNEERPWYQKIIIRILSIATILLSHTTIAVSEITKKQIGWPWNKKIVVIRNGIREMNFLEKAEARKILSEKIHNDSLPANTVWIGTISELHKTKGLKYAIEAVSHIQENVIFVIIGEGQDRKNLEKLITDLKLTNKVFLTGNILSASIYLKAFDIFTLTSITEALPYALLEAGSAALPVIASHVGGIPEIIEGAKTGLLCTPRKSRELQAALEIYIKEPAHAQLLGKQLKEKVTKEFTTESMLQKTFALYKL
jgi:glycosyltransferase involved in cell wall biosynthesis